MIHFDVTRHQLASPEIGDYQTYGIAVLDNGQKIDELCDVTPNLEEAEHLSRMLDRNQVSRNHFRDVVADWLATR